MITIIRGYFVSGMRLELTRAKAHYPLKVARLPIPPSGLFCRSKGAKNGTRTRDPNLGKVVLYQLSYFRKYYSFVAGFLCIRIVED